MFELKQYRGDWKITFGIWQIFIRALESCNALIQSRKYMRLKFTEELYVVIMKNNVKFEQELTCCCKIDMRNLTNVDPSTQKSPKFAL